MSKPSFDKQQALSIELLERIKVAVKDAAEPISSSRHELPTAVGAMLHLNRICIAQQRCRDESSSSPLIEEMQAQNRVVSEVLPRMQASLAQLQGAIFEAKYGRSQPSRQLQPSADIMKDVLVFSHKLSYSSFAPMGKHPQPVYGPFAPPAPSEHHMQFSKLQAFARQQAEKEHQAAAAAAAAEEARIKVEQQQRHTMRGGEMAFEALAAPSAQLAGAWSELTLPQQMPPDWRPPEGWKPGDPISFALPPPGGGVSAPVATTNPEPVDVMDTAPQLNFDLDSGIEFDFVLNADAVDSDLEDEDSDSDMDDDDDDDDGDY